MVFLKQRVQPTLMQQLLLSSCCLRSCCGCDSVTQEPARLHGPIASSLPQPLTVATHKNDPLVLQTGHSPSAVCVYFYILKLEVPVWGETVSVGDSVEWWFCRGCKAACPALGASAGSAAPHTPLGLQPPRKFYCYVCTTSPAVVGAVFMVWLCRDSCFSVNSERGRKKPAVRAVCLQTLTAGLAAAGPGCFLQDLAAGDETSRSCRRQKSLALPENAGQRKFLPPALRAHVFSCQHGHYGEQRCFLLRQQRAKHLGADSPLWGHDATMPGTIWSPAWPRKWRHLAGSAAHLLGITWCLCKSLGINADFIKKRQCLPSPGLVSMGTGHQKSRNAASALK